METPLIVENPDGPISIAVKYVTADEVLVTIDDTPDEVLVTIDDTPELMVLYGHEAEIAKCITMFDFVINLVSLWFFLEPFFGFLAFLSFVGYRGVQRCNIGMLMVYLIYQYMLTIGKGVMIYETIDHHADTKSIIFISVATAVQIWITYSIQKFYNKIRVLRSP
jgi:hypothetical protein